MGSTRLPGKILAPIVDHLPLLAVLVHRIRPAGIPLWLATTEAREDDVTAAWGDALRLRVYRGDEEDVLGRFAGIVDDTKPDWVVRFTADDPFTDAAITRHALQLARDAPSSVDLITSGPNPQFPLGYAPQVIRGSAISRLQREIPLHGTPHRVHVTTGLPSLQCAPIRDPTLPVRPGWRWTIDTLLDLAMARTAFAAFPNGGLMASYTDLVTLFDNDPGIAAINVSVIQKSQVEG